MNTAIQSSYGAGYRIRRGVRLGLNYVVMVLLAIFFLFPIVFMLVSSIKVNETQVMSDMSSLFAFLPRGEIGLQNYSDVFAAMAFGRFMFNSVFIVGTMVTAGLIVNSLMAYALARLHFRGRGLLLGIVVALIIIPFEAVAVPLLLIVNRFGWLDSYHVQIIPFIADAFSIFLFYQFFISLPKDLEDAARVDGASLLRIYWNIILPLSRPVFVHRRHSPIPDSLGRFPLAADGHARGGIPALADRHAAILHHRPQGLGRHHGLCRDDHHTGAHRLPALPALVHAERGQQWREGVSACCSRATGVPWPCSGAP